MFEKIVVKKFPPKEDLAYYLNPDKVELINWYESPTEKELVQLFEMRNTELIENVIPHCKYYFTYPCIEDNIYLYNKLLRPGEFTGLFDPLEFFNIVYQQLTFILCNSLADPDLVLEYILTLNFLKRKMHFLFYSLHYILSGLNGNPIDSNGWPDDIWLVKNENLIDSHLGIIHSYESLSFKLSLNPETKFENQQVRFQLLFAIPTGPERLKIKQIVLIHFYEKKPITRNNASDIAKKYGYYSKNSGEKFYQEYVFYSSNANRKSIPYTTVTLKNKIELFESILEHIEDKAKSWAIDEIKILKTRNRNND